MSTWVHISAIKWRIVLFCSCVSLFLSFFVMVHDYGFVNLPTNPHQVMGYYKATSLPKVSHPLALSVTAATGVFCLSWVGAICDSSVPSCRGNNDIHTTFAITFFILFNL